jgi:uncharacterized protein YjbI with pentapeptide repeats
MSISILDSLGVVIYTDTDVAATQKTAVEKAVLAVISLDDADIVGWNLESANIPGVILTNADCRNVNFKSANLEGANFSGSELAGSNWADANLDNITLTGARLYSSQYGFSKLNNELWQLNLKQWVVYFSGNNITIADKTFTRAQWNNFTNQQILNNSNQKILNRWLIYKPLIIGISQVVINTGL